MTFAVDTKNIRSTFAGVATPAGSTAECILLYAPIGRDALLMAQALQGQGIEACICADTQALIAALHQEYAALLLTMDGLDISFLHDVAEHLNAQPPWSDLPVILLVNAEQPAALEEVWGIFGNVTLLQRPLRRASLISAVRTSLRARRRQYQVRDLLGRAEQARREAEQQQAYIEVLNERLRRAMTETHHRVKNNLQVIAAMVDMRVMEDTHTLPTEEFRRLGSHIHMLAAVHDLLTEKAKADGQARCVSSRAVLEKLLPLMRQLSGNRMAKVEIAEVLLTAKQGTSIALVLNELVSNACKHGRGSVEIRFTTTQSEAIEAILEVCDDGPGFPPDFDPKKAANTGLELVESLSRWDLSGTVRYTTQEGGGGRVQVTMPLLTENP